MDNINNCNKEEKLKEKTEKDYSEYRFNRLLEILLGIDLKKMNDLYQNEKELEK